MQQTMTIDHPLSEVLQVVAPITASLPTRSATLPALPDAGPRIGGSAMGVLPITHLHRLQHIQKVCENQVGQPSFLSVADAILALRGLEYYFAPLFEQYEISLTQVRETLQWAEGECGGALLVEDVIQTLVTGIIEEQSLRRRLTRGGNS